LAVNECLGDYISFLDTDDLYLQDNLRKKLQAIENEEAEVVYGGVIEIRKDGSEYNRFLPKNRSGFLLKNLLMQFEIDVATMMVKRSALIVGRINFDGRIYGSEEYDLMLRMAVNSKFAVIHDHIAKMRVHHGSLSNSVMDKWAQDRRLTLGTILLEHPNLKNQYKNEFQEAFARANYYEARWLVHQGNVLGAISLLWNVKYVNWRYLGLYLVLRISPKLWNLLHKFLRRSRQ
jgi:glycosyltransferase involved in cell wall biosynthesis